MNGGGIAAAMDVLGQRVLALEQENATLRAANAQQREALITANERLSAEASKDSNDT